jgi:hypothetical protein
MTELAPLDRLILYWFWIPFDEEFPEELGMLGVYVNPDGKDRHLRERECFVVGLTLPTWEKSLDSLQRLLEQGYVSIGDATDVRDAIRDRWGFQVVLTKLGTREARKFERFLWSADGRSKSFAFADHHVAACTSGLPFRPILPTYLPKSADPLPEVTTEDRAVALNYHDVIVEEAIGELPGRYRVPPNLELPREDSIDGIPISVTERHVTSVWAEIEQSWQTDDISFRVTVFKNEHPPTAHTDFKYARIDDRMRGEARKIARSILIQLHN